MDDEILIESDVVPGTYYRKRLDETNAALFGMMTSQQQGMEQLRLIRTLWTIRMEAQEHLERKRFAVLHGCVVELEKCLGLLRQLKLTPALRASPDSKMQAAAAAAPERPLRFAGLLIRLDMERARQQADSAHDLDVDSFVKEVQTFVDGVRDFEESADPKRRPFLGDGVKKTHAAIGLLNDYRRLWWVWGTSMFDMVYAVLDAQSISLPHQDQLRAVVGAQVQTWGIISWVLYYFRLGMDLGDAFYTAWSEFKPSEIPSLVQLKHKKFSERLSTELDGRKYLLLNDILWGAVNTLCFFWLNGSLRTSLGSAGAMLSLGLLVGDVTLTICRYLETKKKHQIVMGKLESQEQEILLRWFQRSNPAVLIKSDRQRQDAMEKARREMQGHLNKVEAGETVDGLNEQRWHELTLYQDVVKARALAEFDWRYQQQKLYHELVYTVGLVAGFGIMCGFFIPALAVGTIPLAMGMIGALICFTATIIFNSANALVDREKSHVSSVKHRQQMEKEWVRLFNGTDLEKGTNDRKWLFLQIKMGLARSAYDRELAAYQLRCLPINALIDGLMPVIFFLSMNFLGIGPAIGILAACVVVIYAAKRVMHYGQPVKPEHGFFPAKLEDNQTLRDEFNDLNQKFMTNTQYAFTLEDFEKQVNGKEALQTGSDTAVRRLG